MKTDAILLGVRRRRRGSEPWPLRLPPPKSEPAEAWGWRSLFALLLLLLGAGGYLGALVIGTMATDGCSISANDLPLIVWLLGVTPLLILIGSLIPPLLFYQGRRSTTVLLSLLSPGGAYLVAAIGYLLVLVRVCG